MIEDLTTYTEVDPDEPIILETENIKDVEDTYVYKSGSKRHQQAIG